MTSFLFPETNIESKTGGGGRVKSTGINLCMSRIGVTLGITAVGELRDFVGDLTLAPPGDDPTRCLQGGTSYEILSYEVGHQPPRIYLLLLRVEVFFQYL